MTKRRGPDRPASGRELDVMQALWELGSGTVSEVLKRINDAAAGPPLAYTTVLTHLRSLEAKGWATRDAEGRAHRYRPLVARADAQQQGLGRVLDVLFDGSRELLLTSLVNDRGVSQKQLRRLRALLDERLKGRRP